ncbi:CLUMA_CG021078, isoform A [Clunio marinus]|uniref:CLUMA_CG021078, isoform A n=1 Tax=Clunio marinus TaxID=568069 RepID=A0A1J1J7C6_9DIPT|nr:CLUMA_CG021078, isoform A [Clunio marinus]
MRCFMFLFTLPYTSRTLFISSNNCSISSSSLKRLLKLEEVSENLYDAIFFISPDSTMFQRYCYLIRISKLCDVFWGICRFMRLFKAMSELCQGH